MCLSGKKTRKYNKRKEENKKDDEKAECRRDLYFLVSVWLRNLIAGSILKEWFSMRINMQLKNSQHRNNIPGIFFLKNSIEEDKMRTT